MRYEKCFDIVSIIAFSIDTDTPCISVLYLFWSLVDIFLISCLVILLIVSQTHVKEGDWNKLRN